MSKRIIAILISAMMLVTFMPTMAFAAGDNTTTRNGVVYKVYKNIALITAVNNDFDGRFVSKIRYEGKTYDASFDPDRVLWYSKVKTVRFPSRDFFVDANQLKWLKTVEKYEVYDEGEPVSDPNLFTDDSGLLYESDWYEGQLQYCDLVMCPPAKKGLTEVVLDEKCTEIAEHAFDYTDSQETITKIVLQNDSFYIDKMDYEDSTSLFERLALKSDGTYNLTIRIPSPINSNNIASFYKFASWCQKNGKEGIKIEAPLESVGVKDVTYANRNNAKVYFGDCVLKADEDYVIGDKNKVGNKLSNYNYYTIITGSNHFFLASDEEPWYDFSVVSEYSVTPNKVKSVKITGGKKKLTFKWKADKTKYGKSKNITGYEVAYENQNSTDYKFKKIKGYKKTSATVKNLKKGSYYVKMRSYKSLGGGEYVYSAWSTEKVIEVK